MRLIIHAVESRRAGAERRADACIAAPTISQDDSICKHDANACACAVWGRQGRADAAFTRVVSFRVARRRARRLSEFLNISNLLNGAPSGVFLPLAIERLEPVAEADADLQVVREAVGSLAPIGEDVARRAPYVNHRVAYVEPDDGAA